MFKKSKFLYYQDTKMIIKIVRKKILIAVVVAIAITTGSVLGFVAYLKYFSIAPAELQSSKTAVKGAESIYGTSSEQETLITINQGERLPHIAKKLEDSAIISNQYLFMIFARYKRVNRMIKAGEYAFLSKDTPEKILDMLVKGKVKLHRITIPEGFNIKETATVVEKAGFGTFADFINLATDKNFIQSLGINMDSGGVNPGEDSAEKHNGKHFGINVDSLEGYLFPETYLFPAGTEQKKIIQSMVERFNKVFTPEWQEHCKQSGFTMHEIVTLASIIEKETANTEERPLISSVFHNRLKLGMRLESDPTVIYGISDFNGNITKRDLLTATPYNTYAITGLPAGPIASPGKFSLQAAIFPQKSDFIFFVSKNNTTHYFSKTLKEHNVAVSKYQLKK